MPQRPKREVRQAIIDAGASAFAEIGFERATLAGIARCAGTSVGNVYKYFASKEELFAAAIPAAFVKQLKQQIQRQVKALGDARDVLALAPEHPYHQATDELLRLSLAHRAQILFLLRHAEGTAHAGFVDRLVRQLVGLARGYAEGAYPGAQLTRAERRSLTRTYRAFIAHLAAILEQEKSEAAVREAVRLLSAYHLSGLAGIFRVADHNTPAKTVRS